MIRIRQILCPVDFSEFSRHAVDHAATVARWYEARLVVLHVFLNAAPLALPPLALEEEDRARIMADMRGLTCHLPADVKVDVCIQEAPAIHREILRQAAYREILKEAAERNADLIVMGVQGRGAIDLLVFGSNTARVVRRAICPVLIVHQA